MIAIHQSQFIPWLPYFYKLFSCEDFVILDDVQFQKNGVQNRNMIKTPQGAKWVTIPVSKSSKNSINEVFVSDKLWYKKFIKTIIELNYKKSKNFKDVYRIFENFDFNSISNLSEINKYFLTSIISLISINKKITYSSSLNIKEAKDDLVIEIIKKLGHNEYLTGKGALSYMNLNKFKNAGIKVYCLDFNYSPYNQLWNKSNLFVNNLSIVDLLFNDLNSTYDYIKKNGNIKLIQ